MHDLVTLIREYAQERYYRASWDVVAERWSDAEIAAAIAGARTRRGAIAKAWGRLQQIDAIRDSFDGRVQWGCRPERPTSLFEFLGLCGGLRPDPELNAILDGNVFLGGRAGWLVRDGGLSLDAARRAAVDAHYLADTPWEGGVSVSTINDLLDLIDREARGDRQYPYGQAEVDTSTTRSATMTFRFETLCGARLDDTPAGKQAVITGAERASDATMAQRQANEPLRPKKAQQPCDDGLFSDKRNQQELFR